MDHGDQGRWPDHRLGGLYEDPFDPGWGVEVGYSFHPAAWGQGYATELMATCTEVADNVLGLPEVRAFAHRENLASRRVLEKAGFEVVRYVPEMERLLHRRARRHAGRASARPDDRWS